MKSCLVLLHGPGSSGADISSFLRNVPLPDFNYRTFADAAQTNFMSRGVDDTEDSIGINASLLALELQLDQLDAQFEHIFIGGFSMGGGLALHVLRKPCFSKIRGVFTMGSFLVDSSAVQKKTLNSLLKVPVLMMHGESDPMIRCDWGRRTAANLLLQGVDVQFRTYKGVAHDMDPRELADLLLWVQDVLQQQDLRSEGKMADAAERSSKKGGDGDESEEGEGKEQEGAERKGPARNALPAAIPYTIEPAETGVSVSSGTAALLRVRFAVPTELISVVAGRPVLACGSTFEVLEDRPRGVQVLLQSSDPHSTAHQIGLRLQARVSGGSATLNPCPVS